MIDFPGFYIWNHSSTAVVNGQSFQDWFINSYILNTVGKSPLVSGFFWDDVWYAALFGEASSTLPCLGRRLVHCLVWGGV